VEPVPLAVTGGVVLSNVGYRKQIVAALQGFGIVADPVTPSPNLQKGPYGLRFGMVLKGTAQ